MQNQSNTNNKPKATPDNTKHPLCCNTAAREMIDDLAPEQGIFKDFVKWCRMYSFDTEIPTDIKDLEELHDEAVIFQIDHYELDKQTARVMRHMKDSREFYALEGANRLWPEAGHLTGLLENDLLRFGLTKSNILKLEHVCLKDRRYLWIQVWGKSRVWITQSPDAERMDTTSPRYSPSEVSEISVKIDKARGRVKEHEDDETVSEASAD